MYVWFSLLLKIGLQSYYLQVLSYVKSNILFLINICAFAGLHWLFYEYKYKTPRLAGGGFARLIVILSSDRFCFPCSISASQRLAAGKVNKYGRCHKNG